METLAGPIEKRRVQGGIARLRPPGWRTSAGAAYHVARAGLAPIDASSQ
jgi:hypothetical protein